MTDLPKLFSSPLSLRQAFVEGLEAMLEAHQGLGVFILVLANATYDETIYRRLQQPLKARFALLAQQMRDDLLAGRPIADAPDDVAVFLKLMAVGFDDLPLTRFHQAGPYQLQFNLLRSFRPARMSNTRVEKNCQPFDAAGFHFNKPFLRKEIFWQGDLFGHDCRLLYNKFPFAELHGLLVIDAEAEKSQWLAGSDHRLLWEITAAMGEGIPGIGFAYNGYGAFASVNHQHFQMFARSEGQYPLESAAWAHNGGDEAYPINCYRYSDPEQAWQHLQQLHDANQTYNLLFRPGVLYVLPRRFQGSYQHADWTPGFAWAEVCGAVTTFNNQDLTSLDAATLAAELAKLSLA